MNILIFLVYFMPLQDFILKFAPVGDVALSLLRQLPDAIIFCLFCTVVVARMVENKPFEVLGHSSTYPFLIFILYVSFMSLFVWDGSGIIMLANIKAIARYALIVSIVMNSYISQRTTQRLLRAIYMSIAIQTLIAFVSFIGGGAVRSFFSPRNISDGFAGLAKNFTANMEDISDVFGTFGDTISFGYFMLIGLILAIYSPATPKTKYTLVAIMCFMIFISGSRIITIGIGISATIYCYSIHGATKSVLALISASLLSVAAILLVIAFDVEAFSSSDVNNFWFMFSERYLAMALNQRLGILVYMLPDLISQISVLWGLGPDTQYIAERAPSIFPSATNILLDVIVFIIEDVYWFALLTYYGLIGTSLWCAFILQLYKAVRRANLLHPTIFSRVALVLLLLTIPLNLFNQTFEVRSYSFYLFLFCGIAVRLQRQNVGDRSGL